MHQLSSNTSPRVTRSSAEIRGWIIDEVSRFLNVDAIEIDPAESIHQLGVDSLAALSMTGSLAAWLGKDVSATLLWDHDSINAIADILADSSPKARISLPEGIIALRPHGDRTPVFFFPGLGGHPVTFAELAQRLGDAQPCYGLTVPGVNADREPLTRVEDIAAAMVQTMRHLQPTGPYQLAGYSFGGMLAYEAAQQLTAAGQGVSMLAIFDVYTPDGRKRRPTWQACGVHLYLLLARPGRWKYLCQRIVSRFKSASKIQQGETNSTWPSDKQSPADRLKAIQHHNTSALQHYTPKPYAGTLRLFLASIRETYDMFYKCDATAGWGKLCQGGVSVIPVHGSHLTIFDKTHIDELASQLRVFLGDNRQR
jgi:thioesterase domain-containing protein/acyl carrier protein